MAKQISHCAQPDAEGPGCTRGHVLHNNADVFCVCSLERLWCLNAVLQVGCELIIRNIDLERLGSHRFPTRRYRKRRLRRPSAYAQFSIASWSESHSREGS